MASNPKIVELAKTLTESLGIKRGDLPSASVLIDAALAARNLWVAPLFADDQSHEPHKAVWKRGESVIQVCETLIKDECNFALATLLASSLISPDDDGFTYNRHSAFGLSSSVDDVLHVETESASQRISQEINDLACEILLPRRIASELFHEGLKASEIAEQFDVPLDVILHQLVNYALVSETQNKSNSEASDQKTWTLDALDQSQRNAATVLPGPILVGAGPGTGKTRTLVSRVVHLVSDIGVKPNQILALTFSRAAAAQMKAQIADALRSVGMLGNNASEPWVGTLHSFGMQLVRRYYSKIGFEHEPILIDELASVELLEQNLAECKLDLLLNLYEPGNVLAGIVRRISRAKDELCDPTRYRALAESTLRNSLADLASINEREQAGEKLKKEREAAEEIRDDAQKCIEIASCYELYERLKRERNFVDYGDLIALSVALLEQHSEIARELGRRYPHLLSDEYQDVNRASARMLKLLSSASNGAGLWVVGDHRQSIYRFRGASPVNIDSFHEDFPHGKRLELAVNYRSRKAIVDCFSGFANVSNLHANADLSGGVETQVWNAFRGEGSADCVTLSEAETVEAQNEAVASLVDAEIESDQKPSDIAVLCRTNSQVEAIAEALEAAGVSTLTIGDPFVRPEVQDVLALAAFANGNVMPSIYRVAKMPCYALSDEIVEQINQLASPEITSSITKESDGNPVETGDRSVLETHFAQILTLLDESNEPGAKLLASDCTTLAEFADHPAKAIAFIIFEFCPEVLFADSDHRKSALVQRGIALSQLIALADAYLFRPQIATDEAYKNTRNFVTYLQRTISLGLTPRVAVPANIDPGYVRVMTIHAAKGLEFPVAILPYLSKTGFHGRGASDGLAEPSGMVDEQSNSQDEDRFLFFVGLSRAKDKLILTRPVGDENNTIPISPLLEQLHDWFKGRKIVPKKWQPNSNEKLIHSEIGHEFKATLTGRTPTFTEAALSVYQKCPHQYFYRYIEKLSTSSPKSPYQKLHAVVWETLDWMRISWASGESAELSDMIERFDEIWAERGPVGAPNEEVYKDRGLRMISNVFEHGTNGDIPLAHLPLETELGGAKVRVSADAAFESATGDSLTLVRYKTGKRRDDDHTDKRLSLIRKAAESPGKSINIELRYLLTGDVIPVKPNPRYEPGRIEKYVAAVKGILDSQFDPTPGHECRTCAFTLICER